MDFEPGSAPIERNREALDPAALDSAALTSLEEQILAGLPVCPGYVLADPPDDDGLSDGGIPDGALPGEEVINLEDLSPEDPLWEAFYATPFVLPPDPLTEWEWQLETAHTG
jgi:hypothetical protein